MAQSDTTGDSRALVDRVLEKLDEVVDLTTDDEDEEVLESEESDDDDATDWTARLRPVEHTRKICMDAHQQIDIQKVMRLVQLYREESKVRNDLENGTHARMLDSDTPQAKQGLEGSAILQQIEQGPDLTVADYALLARGLHAKIMHDVDRMTVFTGLTRKSLYLPYTNLGKDAEDVFEVFFESQGEPNQAEVLMLGVATGLPKRVIEEYFSDKLKRTQDIRRAKERLEIKALLRDVKQRGLLDVMRQEEALKSRREGKKAMKE